MPKQNGVADSPSSKGWQAKPDGVVSWQAKPDGVVSWKDLPFNPKLKEKAKELRKAGNLAEVLFWQRVKNKQFLGLDFDRQKIIGNYIVDFFCKNSGFVVEIDGQSHDFKGDYDEKRDSFLETLGLKVFHFQDQEIRKNLDEVMRWLEGEISLPATPHLAYAKHPSAITPRQASPATPL